MSVEVQEEQRTTEEQRTGRADAPATDGAGDAPRPSLMVRWRSIVREIAWRDLVLIALAMASGWCFLFLQSNFLQYLAGIVPVTAGLILGKRVKTHVMTHGLLLGGAGFLFGLVLIALYAALISAGFAPPVVQQFSADAPPAPLTTAELIQFYVSFSFFAIVPFPAFGTVIAQKNEQRKHEMEHEMNERGGKLERPDTVRTLDDLQGQPLPKLGMYVSNLFVRHGFKMKDYRFMDKDRYLDLSLEYQDEPYLVRVSVADKVNTGTVEKLAQDMRQRSIGKGLVVTSTEFTADAQKSARGRKHIVLIDGQTLFDIGEREHR
jgi:hypothetical protein